MKVFIVEHRQSEVVSSKMENVLVHLASSQDKAIKWCKNNLDIEEKNSQKP